MEKKFGGLSDYLWHIFLVRKYLCFPLEEKNEQIYIENAADFSEMEEVARRQGESVALSIVQNAVKRYL